MSSIDSGIVTPPEYAPIGEAVEGEVIGEIVNVPGIGKLTPCELSMFYQLLVGRGRNPDYVAATISFESGFRTTVKNPKSSATGIMQVMDGYARKKFGMSASEVGQQSMAWQIRNIVATWSWPKSDDVGDYHLSHFMPALLGKPDDFVLAEKDSSEKLPGGLTKGKVYQANSPGIDPNKDGLVTIAEFKSHVRGVYSTAAKKPRIPVIYCDLERVSTSSSKGAFPLGPVVGGAVALGTIWLLARRRK